jgi:hypothetical protein
LVSPRPALRRPLFLLFPMIERVVTVLTVQMVGEVGK